ncbi:MAG TPA: DNA topoisomerase IB [Ideonella sp.]|uniref:DNA topoisomerase IB n=1 Tax=Ideonella sp. TaxID=1929293 RepID=UPI002E37ABF2|nr:DNA topoisomerase IB [Ideonella sp.]HEX5684237.1 DNA topoisomerase IB [Ideonella sp.]
MPNHDRQPAACSGLAWVSDSEPGIRRQRRGRHFVYLLPDGRPLRDEAMLQRIRRLAVPPAYQDVWICTRADGHIQATGRDARGRKQYRYHSEWQAHRGQTKFDRLLAFGHVLPRLRQRVSRRLGNAAEPTRERVLATLVRLLDTTWLRIGNDEYARSNGSYGLSTLRNRHAGVRGAELHLSFVGKSGVRHEARLTDRRVARVVRRCQDLPGQELFQYVDDDGVVCRLGSADVNAWLADASGDLHATAKDFRTWHGSVQALALMLEACRAEPVPTAAMVVAEVARRLGNTPAVCRKAYIHPMVLALGDGLASADGRAELLARPWVVSPPAARGLALAERQLMGLLRQATPRRGAARRGT